MYMLAALLYKQNYVVLIYPTMNIVLCRWFIFTTLKTYKISMHQGNIITYYPF